MLPGRRGALPSRRSWNGYTRRLQRRATLCPSEPLLPALSHSLRLCAPLTGGARVRGWHAGPGVPPRDGGCHCCCPAWLQRRGPGPGVCSPRGGGTEGAIAGRRRVRGERMNHHTRVKRASWRALQPAASSLSCPYPSSCGFSLACAASSSSLSRGASPRRAACTASAQPSTPGLSG
jgi:hypothetical protein